MMKQKHSSRLAASAHQTFSNLRDWRRFLPLGLAFGLPQLLRAENHVDYRYEYYGEENDRMKIETHSVYFEQKLSDAVVAKGELIYDGISGATPRGTHVSGVAKTDQVEDTRYAGNVALDWRFRSHLLSPGIAYSEESDYRSIGISLSDAVEFNDKNTILQYGASHNFDDVRHGDRVTWSGKDSTDIIVGLSQLLSPKTVVSGAFTFGYDDGYLNDPYRLAEYAPVFPPFPIGTPEQRPGYRSKEVLHLSATHYFEKVDGSLEATYRFHHDSYEVFSHTLGLNWYQHLGKHLILEPMFRFYTQTAASFYSTQFTDPLPSYLSSDYRLSEFYSLDYGIQATVLINDHLRVVAGYHRYEMRGLDNTTADMYPKANIFTVGLSLRW
jgi:hypothetical protein